MLLKLIHMKLSALQRAKHSKFRLIIETRSKGKDVLIMDHL